MNLVGYAREGKSRETLDAQITSLMDHGLKLDNIFKERRSYLDGERPALSECINSLEPRDTLVVTSLNQIAKSITHLTQLKSSLEEIEVGFIVINQGIDTSKKQNLDLFSIITVFSEFEMDLRLERQLEGIQKAKNSGVRFGRKPIDNKVIQNVKKLFLDGMSVGQISIKLALGRSTIYRLLK
jgi:DNA invertase Pin-like site-specific DNA recombinase